jgi:hypothetical protein
MRARHEEAHWVAYARPPRVVGTGFEVRQRRGGTEVTTAAVSRTRAAEGIREAPPWWNKLLRVFFVSFVATLLTGLLPIIENLTTGQRVDLTVLRSLLLALIVGAIAAGIRAVIAILPIFKDDNDVGILRR